MTHEPKDQTSKGWMSGMMRRLHTDRKGSVAVMFAGAAMVLMLLVAGGIETYRRSLAQAMLQKAVDAAALATKRKEADLKPNMPAAAAKAQGENDGRQLFNTIIGENTKIFPKGSTSASFQWQTDGSIKVVGTGSLDLIFSKLLPAEYRDVTATGVVGYGEPLPTEVALVLDNTASMFRKDNRPQTRFTEMRDAAKKFTHTLFDAAQQSGDNDWLRISVVPWVTSVNVLGEAPRAADASGNAPVISIPDKGSQTFVGTPLGRSGRVNVNSALFNPVGWRGCIAGNSESAGPSIAGGMNWDALNIPSPGLVETQHSEGDIQNVQYSDCSKCTWQDNGQPCPPPVVPTPYVPTPYVPTPYVPTPYVPTPIPVPVPIPPPPGGTQGFLNLLHKVVPQVSPAAIFGDRSPDRVQNKAQNTCAVCVTYCTPYWVKELVCDTAVSALSCYQDISYGRKNPYAPTGSRCFYSYWGCHLRGTATGDVNLANGCVADPNERKIINGQTNWCPWVTPTSWTSLASNGSPEPITGPNINCPTPMLGLSGNRRQVIETIERMTPIPGGTHADVGLRWGLRTLTPSGGWPSFFGLTKNPIAFTPSAMKVMILITDGENTQAEDYAGYWGCKGYLNPGCSGNAPTKKDLDDRMSAWCNAIRTTYKVQLYTIAVNFSNPAAISQLRDCAGDPQHAYSVDAAQLQNVLNIIASSVIRLKITQ